MTTAFLNQVNTLLNEIQETGLYKNEHPIVGPQEAHIELEGGKEVLSFCANNYLGLANHPEVVEAAARSLQETGFGMASVRFICGTQQGHKDLEEKISDFLGTEDTILYPSCFDANGGLFETLLTAEDAVISDTLNHASIIDGIRLCKAKRYRYANNDLKDLEAKIGEAKAGGARFILIATDAVFSMDGIIADLAGICKLAEAHDCLVMIDDCHGGGFLGERGRGTHEHCGVLGKIDIITGTLGKAFGGASGGFTSGKREVIDLLRQRSRPYLFSNTLAPPIVAASLKVFEMLEKDTTFRDRLMENTRYFRSELEKLGLDIIPGQHPIVPVMLYDAGLSQKVANRMMEKGVYVVGFFYPVVPQGKARIRTQVSAAHSREDLDFVLNAFREVRDEFDLTGS